MSPFRCLYFSHYSSDIRLFSVHSLSATISLSVSYMLCIVISHCMNNGCVVCSFFFSMFPTNQFHWCRFVCQKKNAQMDHFRSSDFTSAHTTFWLEQQKKTNIFFFITKRNEWSNFACSFFCFIFWMPVSVLPVCSETHEREECA